MSGFFERFSKQDLSGLSGFSEKTAQTAQILLENSSNRSNLERFLSGISTRVGQQTIRNYVKLATPAKKIPRCKGKKLRQHT